MKYFPINLNIKDKKALIVGGGEIASRKAKSLVACDAKVTIVSLSFCAQLTRMKKIKRIRRGYRKSDLKNVCIVICATDSKAVNRKVYEQAQELGIPVNVVDQPDLCTFTVPAVASKGDLMITISTGGGSPSLSGKIRKKIEKEITDTYSKHLSLLKTMRPKVQAAGLTTEKRMSLLKKMSSDKVHSVLEKEGVQSAKRLLNKMLSAAK